MNNKYYDLEGQKLRREKVFDLVVKYTLENFNQKGVWIDKETVPGLRERLFYCFAFFGSNQPEAVKMANTIMRNSEYYFCHFSPMIATQLLIKHRGKMDKDVERLLEKYVADILPDFKMEENDFVGVNDNFPSMASFTALIGGRLFDREDVYQAGVERIKQLSAMLTRRGVASEFNSPTYSAIQIYSMAEIANYSKDEEVKEIALSCEERLWIDILGHYHPELYQTAGPFSRAYTVDSAGHTHQTRFILYGLLGDKLKINPINTLFLSKNGQEGEILHNGAAFLQESTAWLLGTDLHCPSYLVEAMLNKEYPFEFKATTEHSSSADALPDEPERNPQKEEYTYEYPAATGNISTYMQRDYALGVSSTEFHNGAQTDSFHVIYRRKSKVEQQKDIATVYSRYIINDKKPGEENAYSQFNLKSASSSLWDEGRKLGIQHKNTAMMLYKPKIYGCKGVTSLKLSLIFPAQYGTVEEIWFEEEKLTGLTGESERPCPVFIKDGPVYMAFHPLLLTDYGRKAAVKAEIVNDYVTVSFYNYEGPATDFAARGFLLTGNGFIAEIRSQEEVGSFENFRNLMRNPDIKDSMFSCTHTRQTVSRRTKYQREGLTMECEYSPVSEGVKYIAINGHAPEAPVLEITGLDIKKLPLL